MLCLTQTPLMIFFRKFHKIIKRVCFVIFVGTMSFFTGDVFCYMAVVFPYTRELKQKRRRKQRERHLKM